METKAYKFKTNINCGGCVSKVKPVLDAADGIVRWEVDTDNPDKILTVESNGISVEEIEGLIKAKGFKVEGV